METSHEAPSEPRRSPSKLQTLIEVLAASEAHEKNAHGSVCITASYDELNMPKEFDVC